MPNPMLKQTYTEKPLVLTKGAKRIFRGIYKSQQKPELTADDEVARIKVSEVISKMAFYYEKIRNSVDYREESLLRKGAITRILKRLIVIEGSLAVSKDHQDPEKTAGSLLVELIRAGYLANNKLPENKINEVAVILDKYLKLRQLSWEMAVAEGKLFDRSLNNFKDSADAKSELSDWILGMAASEIEEKLSQNIGTDVIVGDMYQTLERNIELPNGAKYSQDLSIQIYLSIYRNYLKMNDYDILSYVLINYYYPTWEEAGDKLIAEVAENINDLKRASDEQIEHPLKPQLNKIVHKYTVYYTILRDVVERDPREIYDDLHRDQKSFVRQIKKACAVRYKQAKSRLWRAASRSIVYIFLTKSIFVILLEVPAIRFLGEELNPFSLGLNIAFPALLLFSAVAFTKLPGESNTAKIVQGVEEIVFQEKGRSNPLVLKKPARRDAFVNTIFALLYSATFIISFGLVVWALNRLHFSWVSIIIFLFFLAFASFFAIRIKRGAKYLVVVERKENIFTFFWNFFYVPIISTGKWLSTRFSRINVFVFIMDFIIEAPFKVFVRIAEDWSRYLKERRDDLS